MNFEVFYYSKTGHTKQLADAIGSIIVKDAKDITSNSIEEDIDVLFFGSSIYGNGIDPAVVRFFNNNIDANIGCIVNFSTSGVGRSTYDEIKALAESYSIKMAEDQFYCIGEFAGMNSDKPDANDISKIKTFAQDIVNKY